MFFKQPKDNDAKAAKKSALHPYANIEGVLIWDFDDTLAKVENDAKGQLLKRYNPSPVAPDKAKLVWDMLATSKSKFQNYIVTTGTDLVRIRNFCNDNRLYDFTIITVLTKEQALAVQNDLEWPRKYPNLKANAVEKIRNALPHLPTSRFFFADDSAFWTKSITNEKLANAYAADEKGSHFSDCRTKFLTPLLAEVKQESTLAFKKLIQQINKFDPALKFDPDNDKKPFIELIAQIQAHPVKTTQRSRLLKALTVIPPSSVLDDDQLRLVHNNLILELTPIPGSAKCLKDFIAAFNDYIKFFLPDFMREKEIPKSVLLIRKGLIDINYNYFVKSSDQFSRVAAILDLLKFVADERLGHGFFAAIYNAIFHEEATLGEFYKICQQLPKLENTATCFEELQQFTTKLIELKAEFLKGVTPSNFSIGL